MQKKTWIIHENRRAKVTGGSTSRSARSKKLRDNRAKLRNNRSHEDRPVTANVTKKTGEAPQNCRQQTHVNQPVTVSVANSLGSHIMKNRKIVPRSIPSKNSRTDEHVFQSETYSSGDLSKLWQEASTQNNHAPALPIIPIVMFSWAG